jgi:small subunit ribosomal protein S6
MHNPNMYEAAIIFRPELDEETVTAAVERLCQRIRDGGGTPGDPDRWGRRHLAYEIDGARDGIYVILPFTAPPAVPAELERVMRISEEILRFLVVHPPEPSPGRRVAAEGPGDATAGAVSTPTPAAAAGGAQAAAAVVAAPASDPDHGADAS